LNTAAIKNPDLISDAALAFGSSTVVVSIEAKKMPHGGYEAYIDCGRERTGRDVAAWAGEAEQRGAGEILITSVDREGTGAGFDRQLIEMVSAAVSVPVVASGGAGRRAHVAELVSQTDISGVAVASVLHYEFISRGGRSTASFSRIEPSSLAGLKQAILAAGGRTRASGAHAPA
jgi:cyclase